MISKLKLLFLLLVVAYASKRVRDEVEIIPDDEPKVKQIKFNEPEKVEKGSSFHHVNFLTFPEVIRNALTLERPLTDEDLLLFCIKTDRFEQINTLLGDKKRYLKLNREHLDALKVKNLKKFVQESPVLLNHPGVHRLLALPMSLTHDFDVVSTFVGNLRGVAANLSVYQQVFESIPLYCNLLWTILEFGNEALRAKKDIVVLDRIAFEFMTTTMTSDAAIDALINCNWDPLSMSHIARIFRFAVQLNVKPGYEHFLKANLVQSTQVFMHGIFLGNMMILVEGRLDILKRFLAFGVSLDEKISFRVGKQYDEDDLGEYNSISTLAHLWSAADEEMKSFLLTQSYSQLTLLQALEDAQRYHFEDLHSFCDLRLLELA